MTCYGLPNLVCSDLICSIQITEQSLFSLSYPMFSIPCCLYSSQDPISAIQKSILFCISLSILYIITLLLCSYYPLFVLIYNSCLISLIFHYLLFFILYTYLIILPCLLYNHISVLYLLFKMTHWCSIIFFSPLFIIYYLRHIISLFMFFFHILSPLCFIPYLLFHILYRLHYSSSIQNTSFTISYSLFYIS